MLPTLCFLHSHVCNADQFKQLAVAAFMWAVKGQESWLSADQGMHDHGQHVALCTVGCKMLLLLGVMMMTLMMTS